MANGSGLWTPGSQLSQDMIALAQELNDKYPNLSLGWIPPEARGNNDTRPFAIIQIDSAGNQKAVIKPLSPLEMHASFIFNWLWENDSQRMDPWKKYIEGINRDEEIKRKKEQDRMFELAEVVHAVAKSNKHEYKINGQKIGSDNNAPTLGLNNAGRTEN
jgi:hypothetical protein